MHLYSGSARHYSDGVLFNSDAEELIEFEIILFCAQDVTLMC